MIIKVTFNDNDFTQVLDEFFAGSLMINLTYCAEKYTKDESEENIRKYVEIRKEADKYMHLICEGKVFTEDEEIGFKEMLRKSILDYVRTNYDEDYDYLSDELVITLQNSVTDHWENGEVLYYFPMHDKYIIM